MSQSKPNNKVQNDSDDEEFETSDSSEDDDMEGGDDKEDDHDGDDPESDSDNPGEDNPDELDGNQSASTTESESESSDESGASESEEEIIKDEDAESEESEQEEEDNEVVETGEDEGPSVEPKISTKNLNKTKELLIIDENAMKEYAMLPKKPAKTKKTKRQLTVYEVARILGQRAQQIAKGAPALVEAIDQYTPQAQAYIELKEKQTPFIIRRYVAKGEYEDWDVADLELNITLDDDYYQPDNSDLVPPKEPEEFLGKPTTKDD